MNDEPPFTVRHTAGRTVVEFHPDSLKKGTELERVGLNLYRLIDERTAGTRDQGGPEAGDPNGHTPPLRLILDFSQVQSVSSQAVGLLLGLNKKLRRGRIGSLTLCGVGPSVLLILRITRLDQVLHIAATQAEALAQGTGGAKGARDGPPPA